MPLAGEQLTIKEALALGHVAGFRGPKLIELVAIMCGESGRYTRAWHDNVVDDKITSTDRGLMQLNSKAQPDVSEEEAYDPVFNVTYAFKISQGGEDWHWWMAYTSGSYEKFMAGVKEVKDNDNWKSRTKLWE
jgi:hypothetical protein